LALLAEAASAPQFAPAEVARLTAQRLAELGQLRTSAGRLANWLLRSTVLDPAHRSARLSGGGRASVAAIQAADVQAFHARCYGPGAATLIVAGDLPASAVQEAAEAAFGSWEHSVIPTSHEPAWPAARRRRLIHRPGAVQADIRLGTWGPDRRDPLWPAFQVASVIMGGGFASRLNQALREERGWTYDVSVTPHALRQGGWICLATSTQTATAVPLIEESLGLLALEAGGFSEAERRDAVGFLTGVAPLSFSTADAVTGHGAGLASHGLDPQTAEAELEALAQVTAAEAEAAWRTFIDPDQMSLVVLGDGDQLAGPLALTPEPLPQL
jgi:predicted Zn-dependent peptidase